MTGSVHEFGRYADVRDALANPDLVPPPALPGPPGSMAWLRATVARFSSGEAHGRRRALVEADLSRLDPAALRAAAASASGSGGDARLLVVRTLAEGLGIDDPDAVARAVSLLAGRYLVAADRQPGAVSEAEAEAEADAAVAWLLPRMLPMDPTGYPALLEAAASRIGLLVQACDATGGLVDRARRAAAGCPAVHTTERMTAALLTETLRYDPPVRSTRRFAVRRTRIAWTAIAKGDQVVLDLAAANRDAGFFTDPDSFDPGRSGPAHLTFGSGPRPCPGRAHALALATGILDRSQAPAQAPTQAPVQAPATEEAR